jgi:TM2 domain-containing membrane protein YozV
MKNKSIIVVFLFLWLLQSNVNAQNLFNQSHRFQLLCHNSQGFHFYSDSLKNLKTDSSRVVKKTKVHYPKVAVLLSTLVPGAGQIYNKKYWKTPIAWAGIGTGIYFVRRNHILYKDYKGALLQRVDTNSTEPDKYLDIYSSEQLVTLQDQYRQNRDLFIIVSSLVYVMNIIDALVDAHLFSFDVSDDLSLNWQPYYRYSVNTNNTAGLSLRLTFR